MIARKYELSDLSSSFLFYDHLSKVTQKLREIGFREYLFPHIARTDPIFALRIARSFIVSSVEWEEPSFGVFQTSRHIDELSIESKMHQTSLESE